MADLQAPAIFFQWKGTDACLDFQCTCSDPADAYEFHLDGHLYGGRLQCPRCRTVYVLGDPTITVEDPTITAGWPPPAMLTAE